MRSGMYQGLAVPLFLLLGPLLRAANPVNLDIDIGWRGHARIGTWTPIFIHVSTRDPVGAMIEISAPHDSSAAVNIQQPIAIGPSSQTYTVYVPLLESWNNPIALKIRDRATGKVLIEQSVLDRTNDDYMSQNGTLFKRGSNLFIGVSGRGPVMGDLANGQTMPQMGYLKEEYLPRIAKGYDGITTLVLNQPDFNSMELAQQNAIAEWVRAGGQLILWPSEDPIPSGTPLVNLLPCRLGEVTTVTIPKEDAHLAGLSERFTHFKAREITPIDGAVSLPLFGSAGVSAVRGRRGLGYVTVIPFDASGLQFDHSDRAMAFWTTTLDVASRGYARYVGNSWMFDQKDNTEQRRSIAAGQVIDLLGNVPGVGSFGFKYVAIVLLAMMALLGPIDWFVLKWLRRQPWTWITMLTWIGSITTAALFIGSIFRSGDLHFRTLRVIDQADGAVVARNDIVGIYSPKTADYRIDTSKQGWWEPISTDQNGFGRGVLQTNDFDQDGRTNLPGEMRINVWNLRFLSGVSTEKQPLVIEASLQLKARNVNTPKFITGTITNLGDVPVKHLWLRTRDATTDLTKDYGFPAGGLPPKGTMRIELPENLSVNPRDFWQSPPLNNYSYGFRASSNMSDPLMIAKAAGDLSPLRSHRITGLVEGSEFGVIYAEMESPVPAATLIGQQAIERHWQVIRAVVPLKN